MKSDKPDLIILEGPDKAGKSTVYQAFRKATFYQPLVIDRFIGSNIVYDQLHDRLDKHTAHYNMEVRLKDIFNPLVVYLWAPDHVLMRRSDMAGDLDEEREDIEGIHEYYEEYLRLTPLEILTIDTSIIPVDEVVKTIKWTLSHRQNEVRNQWSA